MKKFFLFILIFLSFKGYCFSQTPPKLDLTKDGIKPVVIEFDTSHNAALIYTRIKEWIKLNNKNPDAVTKIDNENSLIKFSCYKPEAWKSKINNVDYWNALQFTFTVEIKNAKCRITFASEETRYKNWYNPDGTLIERFTEHETIFENTVNETLLSLYNYIVATDKPKPDDW